MGESIRKSPKRRIFDIIQIGNKDDLISRLFDWFIVIIIILNILTVFLDTFEELSGLRPLFRVVEAVTVFFFWLILPTCRLPFMLLSCPPHIWGGL